MQTAGVALNGDEMDGESVLLESVAKPSAAGAEIHPFLLARAATAAAP